MIFARSKDAFDAGDCLMAEAPRLIHALQELSEVFVVNPYSGPLSVRASAMNRVNGADGISAGRSEQVQRFAPFPQRSGNRVFVGSYHHSVRIVLKLRNVSLDTFSHLFEFSEKDEAIASRYERFLSSFVVNFLFALPVRHAYRNKNRRDAADCLYPGREVLRYPIRRARSAAHERPDKERPSGETHQRNHYPVSVGSSLLHVFPPSMDRILPPEVAA